MITIRNVTISPQIAAPSQDINISVDVFDTCWETIKDEFTTWQDLKDSLASWTEVKNYTGEEG